MPLLLTDMVTLRNFVGSLVRVFETAIRVLETACTTRWRVVDTDGPRSHHPLRRSGQSSTIGRPIMSAVSLGRGLWRGLGARVG